MLTAKTKAPTPPRNRPVRQKAGSRVTRKILTQLTRKIFRIYRNVMRRCGELGLKIDRQRPSNFTEHNFHMVENCAS